MHPDERVEAFDSVGLDDLEHLAQALLSQAGNCRVWLFFGEMGSGKTTLIKALCAALGVKDLVSSPSYSIVNEYLLEAGKVYHFDFYRIKNEEEAYDIGTVDYLYSGDYCFIEWPEKIPSLVPEFHVRIDIQLVNLNRRTIAISIHDGKAQNRV